MTTAAYLDRWRARDAITSAQYETLRALVLKRRFSLFVELNALLYLGVIALVAGLGLTVYQHFAKLGDTAVIAPLAALFAGCLYYCFSRAVPYSPDAVDSPTFAFDYVLYLACLVFGIALGYLEYRFHLLRANWDIYLLASAVLYFALAYRFDNRFVLALALSTLAGWFGIRFSLGGFHLAGSMRADALIYGALITFAGWSTHRRGVKPHFFSTYLHVAANAVFAALVSGVAAGDHRTLWLIGLLGASAVAIERGVRFRQFVFVVYGTVYGYLGLSIQIVRALRDERSVLAYIVVSAITIVGLLATISRRFGREE